MSTLLLSLLIFGLVSLIIYKQLKGNGHCEDCSSDCVLKKKTNSKIKTGKYRKYN